MVTTLGKACILKSGKFIAAKEIHEQYADGLFPCFGGNGIRGYVAEYSHDGTYPLIGRQGALCGNVNYANGKFRATEHAVVVQPVEEIDTRWLYYKLTAMNLGQYATGAAQPGLAVSKLEQLPLTIPSYEDQKRTAKMFDMVEHLITLRREQLANLDQLVKSRFIELFEDEESQKKTVEELCSAIVDCPHTTPQYKGKLKNPAIRTSEIKKGYITWETMRYVSDEEYEERTARLKPEAGDIVYGREGIFGNAAILPKGYNFCLGQRVMLLRPDYSKCTSEYLLYAVISDDVYRQAAAKNNASTVAHVNVKDVKQFKIPLPSFDKQHQFAAFVAETDKLKLAIQQSLDKLEILKKSLMQEYFG